MTVAQKLREVIEAYGSSFGETAAGSAWAIKALHPSDPITEVAGVPDQSAMPTTFLNYMQQTQIVAPIAGLTWECEIHITADPSMPYVVYKRTSTNTNISATEVFNKALGDGATYDSVCGAWMAEFERWRLGYYGISSYLNAPATASQGTVTAAQHATAFTKVYPGVDPLHASVPNGGCVRFQANDIPPYDAVSALPNAYTGEAVAGCYMPLKLDSNHAVWHTGDDYVYDVSNWGYAGGNTGQLGPIANSLPSGFLYPNASGLYSAAGGWAGRKHLLPMTGILGTIAYRGLSDQASINVVCRMGVEAQVQAGSLFVPYLRLSPSYDPTAIGTYFKVARELKDAYPVEYNDLGKLWGVIKQAAKVVNPFLGAIPGGDAIRAVGKVVGTLGDAYTSKSGGRAPQLMSEAQLERVQEAAKAATAASAVARAPKPVVAKAKAARKKGVPKRK